MDKNVRKLILPSTKMSEKLIEDSRSGQKCQKFLKRRSHRKVEKCLKISLAKSGRCPKNW